MVVVSNHHGNPVFTYKNSLQKLVSIYSNSKFGIFPISKLTRGRFDNFVEEVKYGAQQEDVDVAARQLCVEPLPESF